MDVRKPLNVHAYLYDADGRDREVALDELSADKLGPEDARVG